MSELRVNSIDKRDGNNVSMSDPLRLKNVTTTQMNALTSVAGDIIYNTTEEAPYYYDGSDWNVMKDIVALEVSYIIVAGGGGGGVARSSSGCQSSPNMLIFSCSMAACSFWQACLRSMIFTMVE